MKTIFYLQLAILTDHGSHWLDVAAFVRHFLDPDAWSCRMGSSKLLKENPGSDDLNAELLPTYDPFDNRNVRWEVRRRSIAIK